MQHQTAAIVKIRRMKGCAQSSGPVLQHGKRDVTIDEARGDELVQRRETSSGLCATGRDQPGPITVSSAPTLEKCTRSQPPWKP